jgi:polyisoprenoid-binding protein YceI
METPMAIAKDGKVHFEMDMKASLLTVQAFAAGIVSVIAHSPKFAIRDVAGDILFDPKTIENSSLRASIKLGSLEIMDEVNTMERREIERVMFDEVLEKSIYPTAEFRTTRVSAAKTGENMYRLNLGADMTLHGISRGMMFDSQLVAGEDTLRAQGSFSLLQSDFNLKIASVANGTLKLKDELKFGFFVIARRKG